jgi:multiple sugar transport system permease protein
LQQNGRRCKTCRAAHFGKVRAIQVPEENVFSPHGGSKRWRMLRKNGEPYFYILPTVILIILLLIIPIGMVICYSFFNNVIIESSPKFVGFSNYISILTDSEFSNAIKNTLYFVCVSVVAHLILGMLFAMLLNSSYLRTRTKSIFRVIYVLPWMFTASVIAILWKLMLDPNGIVNYMTQLIAGSGIGQIEWLSSIDLALPAVTLINIWAGYPFYMISILAGLQGISNDLYEAASLDGANAPQTFFWITIPQLKPILVSLIMLDFVWTIQQFALIWMTTAGGPINATNTLSTYIYKQAFSKYQYSLSAASSVIVLIICTIIAVFYVKHQKASD